MGIITTYVRMISVTTQYVQRTSCSVHISSKCYALIQRLEVVRELREVTAYKVFHRPSLSTHKVSEMNEVDYKKSR